MDEEQSLNQELQRLWTAWGHLRQQIHASEDTFKQLPTEYKADKLADRRHQLHLIELDIADIDDKLADEINRKKKFLGALRELA